MVAPSSAPAPGAGASLAATALLMVNNTVGAGLLALPYVLLRSGLVPGLCAMALTGTLNCLMAVLLAQNCALCGARSYAELATHAFGARAAWAISLLMAVYTLGSCASYAVLLGDALPELADSGAGGGGGGAGAVTSVFASRAVLLPACAALVLFPLSAQRNLKSLRFTAAAAVLCILYVAGLVISRAARAPRAASAVDYSAGGGAGLFVGIPITMVSFTCHYNVPRMYFELEARSVRRLAAAAAACFGFALALYLSTAAAGYVLFGAATKNDILADFADDDVAALVARVALVIVMSFSFPIVFNNFRAMTVSLLPQALQERIDIMGKAGTVVAGEGEAGGAKRLGDDPGGETGGGGGGGGCCPALASAARDWPFLLTTAVLVAACVLVAAAVPDLGLILGYKGALGASFILYILPGAFYFALVRRARRRAAAAPLDEFAVGVGVGAGAGATPAMTPRRVPAMRFLSFAFGAGTTAAAGSLSARSTASGAGGGFFRALQSAGAAAGGGGGGGSGADAEDARATHTPLLWAAAAAATPAGSEAASAASPPSPSLTPTPTPKPLPLSIGGEGGEGEEALGGGEGVSLAGIVGELLTTRHGLVALALGLWGGTVLVLGTLTTAGALKL